MELDTFRAAFRSLKTRALALVQAPFQNGFDVYQGTNSHLLIDCFNSM